MWALLCRIIRFLFVEGCCVYGIEFNFFLSFFLSFFLPRNSLADAPSLSLSLPLFFFLSLQKIKLNGLSFDVRNKIQEEVHGVTSLEFVETTTKIKDALEQFDNYITISISNENKQAYTYAIDELKSTYIKENDFRLAFLRADLFDIPKAAVRYTSYLDVILKYFGPEGLQRPLRFDDLTKTEQDYYRGGCNQILPSRDRSGRLVVFMKGTADVNSVRERVRHILQSWEYDV